MAREIAARILQALVTLWITTIVVFLLVRLTGSPVDVILPDTATAEQRAALVSSGWTDRSSPSTGATRPASPAAIWAS